MPDPADSDAALYGKDGTPGIVDVQIARGGGEQAVATVFQRDAEGSLRAEPAPFFPFFFLSRADLLRGFPRERYQIRRLEGQNFYQYAVAFRSLQDYRDALRHVERTGNGEEGRSAERYLVGNLASQYLLQSGRTLFKGMAFDQLHRLQLDIEVYSESGFPNAARPGDAVIIVALSDNRSWHHILHARDRDEAALLREMVQVIAERDPDVIEGHNLLGFDLPYLLARCLRHDVALALGRDGSVPRTSPAVMRFAERSVEYTAFEIMGRHVIDTYFQVLSFDVVKRNLPGYSLKVAARYFGLAPADRVYVEGEDIARTWRTDPDRLIAYAHHDVMETERLARHLSGSTFYLTQMLPMRYEAVARSGPAAKIEALFVREYLRQRRSVPRPGQGTQAMGGYTDVFVTGVVGPIVYADVESLYPSIMLQYDVRPAADALHLFPALLRRLTDLRIATKHRMKEAATDEERSELDARQSSYKLLINSFYGQLGFSQAAFNDFAEADRVAATGQKILRSIIEAIRREGGLVVEVDTDGVLFVPPPDVHDEPAERRFVARLGEALPRGIRIGYEGRFRKMLSYKKKNYALLTYDHHIRFKGSSLVSRSIERFGRQFVREATRLLLDEDLAGLHRLYLEVRERIVTHAWHGVDDFSRTETLKDTVDQYRRDVAEGRRSRAAAYELAIALADRTGRPVRKGDRIAYYVTGVAASVTSFENSRLASEWRPEAPDENTAYYLKRLDEFARKFEPFFTEHDFRLLFSPEDMFGFSAGGIRILQQTSEGDPGARTTSP